MGDEQEKDQDRRSIEERRRLFTKKIQAEHLREAHARIARSGVCLSMRWTDGEDLLRSGTWRPDAESRSLAQDPHAPGDLLLHLARHLPAEVLANPSLPLELMSNPGVIAQIAPESLLALARHPAAPASLLEVILRAHPGHADIREAVARHPSTPEPLRAELASPR